MKVYTCTDHEGHWPVGVASIVVAHDSIEAKRLLIAALAENGLRQAEPFTLVEVNLTFPQAIVLNNGDY